MITSQVRSMVNPHRTKKRRMNPKKRRKLSPKQIKIFGTKSQKAALKRRRTKRAVANPAPRKRRRKATAARRTKAKVRTVTKVVYKTRRAKRRKTNPGIVTLGLINPGGRMAKRRKKTRVASHRRRRVAVTSNPRRRRRRANPARVVVRYKSRRRSNPGRRRHRSYRNPISGGVGNLAINTLAGIISNSASKFVATQVSGMIGQSSPFVTAALQIATGYGLHKLSPAKYKDAVLLGALIGAGTTILSTVAPGLGLGDWVSAPLLIPYNGIRTGATQARAAALAASTGGKSARMGVSGLGRSFGRSF